MRLRASNRLFVGHHDVEVLSVEPSRSYLYVCVPEWWSDRSLYWEPSRHLCVPSSFILSYYSNYLLVEKVATVAANVLWNVSNIEMVAFMVVSFLACAQEGAVYTSTDDRRLVFPGYGVIVPSPAGTVESIQTNCLFPLLIGCDINMPLTLVAHFHTMDIDWVRSNRVRRLYGPYFLYFFGHGMPSRLAVFTRRKRPRSSVDCDPDVVITFTIMQPHLFPSYEVQTSLSACVPSSEIWRASQRHVNIDSGTL